MFPRTGLWRHADFMRLWSAQMFSAFGSRITRTALPIIAVATLDQPEWVVGALMVAQLAPGIVVGLTCGGLIDRTSKRKILVGADLVRAATVISLTIAWLAGILSMVHVIVVGTLVGGASALFQITDNAYLPALIPKQDLAEGNAKLESTEAIAEITGPASAGALIAAFGAPLAVAIDAASYVWSALRLGAIKAVEHVPPPQVSASMTASRRGHLRVGLRVVFGHPIVRPIVLSHMVWAISGGFFMALYTLFLLRELGISETVFGIIVAMGGIGSLFGAVLSRRIVAKLGLGRALVTMSAMSLVCALLIPLAGWNAATGGSFAVAVAYLCAHQLLSDGFSVAFVIQAVTLRQTVLPRNVLGRANAAIHVFTSGLLPIGALLAGVIAELASTQIAVWVGVCLGLVAPAFLLPLRHLKEMPPSPDDTASPGVPKG